MAENELRDIYVMLLVHDDRNSVPVVKHSYNIFIGINCDLNLVHGRIALLVVCCINNDLVKYFVQTRNERARSKNHFLAVGIEHPHMLCLLFNRANYECVKIGKKVLYSAYCRCLVSRECAQVEFSFGTFAQ